MDYVWGYTMHVYHNIDITNDGLCGYNIQYKMYLI